MKFRYVLLTAVFLDVAIAVATLDMCKARVDVIVIAVNLALMPFATGLGSSKGEPDGR